MTAFFHCLQTMPHLVYMSPPSSRKLQLMLIQLVRPARFGNNIVENIGSLTACKIFGNYSNAPSSVNRLQWDQLQNIYACEGIECSRLVASFRGINRLASAFMSLRRFGCAYICVQVAGLRKATRGYISTTKLKKTSSKWSLQRSTQSVSRNRLIGFVKSVSTTKTFTHNLLSGDRLQKCTEQFLPPIIFCVPCWV